MLRALDAVTGAETTNFGPGISNVLSMDLSGDGKLLAAVTNQSGAGYELRLWTTKSPKPEATLFASASPIANVCFGPDSKYLAASDRTGSVHVWDVARRVEIARLQKQPVVRGLAFSPTGEWLVQAGGKILLHRVRDWGDERVISMPAETRSIAFAAGGKQLVAGLADGSLALLSVADGSKSLTLNSGSSKALNIVAVSPDGALIIAANDDGSTFVRSADGKLLKTISGPARTAATAIAFYPQTSVVVLAGADGIVRMYDSQTARLLKMFDLGGTYLVGLAFSPDGQTLITGGQPQALTTAVRRVRPLERPRTDLMQRHDSAILFATNEYDFWPALVNPVPDAETLRDVLQNDYGFEVQVVRNPTREEILNSLRTAHQRKFGSADQLMIFFAGHGTYDREIADGFVIARDSLAVDRNHTSQISYADLRSNIDSIPAQHILVAMDVCQGGMMLASGDRGNESYGLLSLPELLVRKSHLTTRKLVASGLDDYVSDGFPGHHSPFVTALLEELRSYGRSAGYITVAALFASLERVKPGPVIGDWGKYEPGSDFFFIPREKQRELAKQTRTLATPRTASTATATPAAVVHVSSPIRRTIAVLPFRNLRKELPDEYLSSVMEEQLWSELTDAGTVRTLDLSMVEQVVRDQHWDKPDELTPEQLAWAAQNLGADLVLSGSYAKLGPEQVVVNFQVVSAHDARLMHRFTDSSKESELPSTLLRREGVRLRRILGAVDGPAQRMSFAVPKNHEAGALYAEALQKMRRNEFAAARDLFEKVIIIEPNFSLAHAGLAHVYTSLGYDAKARGESKTAFELREGLGANEAKLIEGRYHASHADWERAIAALNALWSFNSDTIDYALELADVLRESGRTRQAIKLLDQVKERAPAPEDNLRLEIMEAHAYLDMADYLRLKTTAEVAVRDAEGLGAEQLLAEALLYDSIATRRLGDPGQALPVAERGAKIVGDSNPLLQARLLTAIGNAYSDRGESEAALQIKKRALEVARAAEDQRDLAGALANLANIMIGRGELDEAADYYKEAIGVAQKIEDLLGESLGRFNLAGVLRAKGDLDGARGLLEQSEQLYRTTHNEPKAERASQGIGEILLETGDIKGARQRLEAAQRVMEQTGINEYLPGVMLSLGDTLAAEGDLKGAFEQYQRASAICEKMRNPRCTAGCQLSAAFVLLDEGQPQKAFVLAGAAAELFRSQKAPANELQARVALAQVLLAENRPREALAEVDKSEALRVPDRVLQIYLAITAARVQSQLGSKQAATERLQNVIENAKKIGARHAQFEAELAVLKIRNGAGSQVSASLDLLHKEAADLGYGLIASKAAR